MATQTPTRLYQVRNSPIHGRGVFAALPIPKGTCIIEYRGVRTDWDEALSRPDSDPDNPFHTFFFELDDGRVIDAGRRGNAARWINHSCKPNCKTKEDDAGRVHVYAKRDIEPGEELAYDYNLSVDGGVTKKEPPTSSAAAARRNAAARCSPTRRAPERRTRRKRRRTGRRRKSNELGPRRAVQAGGEELRLMALRRLRAIEDPRCLGDQEPLVVGVPREPAQFGWEGSDRREVRIEAVQERRADMPLSRERAALATKSEPSMQSVSVGRSPRHPSRARRQGRPRPRGQACGASAFSSGVWRGGASQSSPPSRPL